jgi:HSP20 family protein
MLTRWDPFRELKGVEAEFDRIVGQTFPKSAWVPALDIRETDDRFEVTADLPGVSSDDVEVTFEDATLMIRGEREFSRNQDEGRYHRIERSYGSFARSVRLPRVADSERIEASFDDGVLTVLVPKREEAKPRTIEVKAK